jgi:four helix bundle protein
VNQKAEALKNRTATFAKTVINLCELVVESQASRRITGQLIDAATSVAANYRAACRARSRAEFVAKIGVVREEADESQGWLQLLLETNRLTPEEAGPAIAEAGELIAIFSASYYTAKNRGKKQHAPREY